MFPVSFARCIFKITLLTLLCAALPDFSSLHAHVTQVPQATQETFEPFTGRIRRNKVRMRIGADVHSNIVSELPQGSLIAVVGEQDDFYAVRPNEKTKVYVYRTYILNHTVDASSVNVRLEPAMDAPVIGQLHKGDTAYGPVSKLDDQWLEIDLPQQLSFYVAKEFIEKAGPPSYLAMMQANKKVEAAAHEEQSAHALHTPLPTIPSDMPTNMAAWIPREQALFEQWHAQNPEKDILGFYAEQKLAAVTLEGTLEPYTRAVRNRPGNFLLIHPTEGHPIAFVYSTQVDLKDHVGGRITLLAAPRPNYNFAFPAFFVLSIL